MVDEFAHMTSDNYDIHPSREAKVFDFFYEHYVDEFRSSYLDQMRAIVNSEEYSGYKIVFTGHSLGGALTLHAAVDGIISGLFTSHDVIIYTFGQPRIGNIEFNDLYLNGVKEFYRIIHNNDVVPHLPPCITDLNNGCVKDGFLIPIFPYHAPTEIFYNEGMTNYKVCSSTEGEDNTCSDQISSPSIDEHLVYFGVDVGKYHRHYSVDLSEEATIEELIK